MLKRAEVRRRLGIGKDKYLELIRSGELEAIQAGDAPNSPYLVSEEALADFIERKRFRPRQEAGIQ